MKVVYRKRNRAAPPDVRATVSRPVSVPVSRGSQRLASYLWFCLVLGVSATLGVLVLRRFSDAPGEAAAARAGASAPKRNAGLLRPAPRESGAADESLISSSPSSVPSARASGDARRAAAHSDPVPGAAPTRELGSSEAERHSANTPAKAVRPSRARQVALSSFEPWSQPGLCASSEAFQVRETLRSRFRLWDGGGRAQFYLDPRLDVGAPDPILRHLEWAEHEVATRLNINATRPEVFVYFDKQLLKAAGCINEDVVAYYDGALHVVAKQPDVRESVLHEYAHHALISSGMLGPAWAQEGIAMHIARETWWVDAEWLKPLAANPIPLTELDAAIPYQLPPERAVAFYVQSAALVACVVEARNWRLGELYEALRGGADVASGTLGYDLPELEQSAFVRSCLEGWME